MTRTEDARAPNGIVRLDRPADHVDQDVETIRAPQLSPAGWARWGWRQLTSMRTALLLLLLLALAAVPGSLFPQRSADPNGVVQHFAQDPAMAELLDTFQLFDVYSSVWFSAIYLLLFLSLIGCVVPRIRHHVTAIRAAPPATPKNLGRLPAHQRDIVTNVPLLDAVDEAERELREARYRVVRAQESDGQISLAAERGYLRETGNLIFHIALVGVLITVAIGGGFKYTGQRVLVEGQTFVNSRLAFDSFEAGRFVTDDSLPPFSLTLERFTVSYVTDNVNALGLADAFVADVSVSSRAAESRTSARIEVNSPLSVDGSDIYLLGNGYAPRITVRDPSGAVVFTDTVPFLPQDANLTSLGVVKVPDGLARQVGMIGFFYPTRATTSAGASYSSYPDLVLPVLTLNVYVGDLGLDAGIPKSVYQLDTSAMTEVAGGESGVAALELTPGSQAELPGGLGSVELDDIPRFASFDIAHDPTQVPVLVAAIAALVGLSLSLFVPRRRVWIRATQLRGAVQLEYGGLARGDDPQLLPSVESLVRRIATRLTRTTPKDRS
ncbi:cytochrome c biogenesis protein ResB [Pseudolysinimonas yzui]|nr:cytochrome c biogenesis protein ResB [Pseudolysinimonas yzui]